MTTVLLHTGKVVDGTGNSAFDGHVLIDGDRIKAVLKQEEPLPLADQAIDATGHVIAPGFIDMHSHLDWVLPLDDHPGFLNCLPEQGITTLVGGNCGFSPAPIKRETLALVDTSAVVRACIDKPLDYNWQSMGQFLSKIDETKPIVNLAQLVGHGTTRLTVAGRRRGAMNAEELKSCLDQVRRSLDVGACGLSFGLGYEPGMYSPDEELETFSAVAAKAQKPVAVHLKAYTKISAAYLPPYFKPHKLPSYLKPHTVRALKEMIDIARRTEVKLQVSHLVFIGTKTWPTAGECIEILQEAHGQGIDVMTDALPYHCGPGPINALLPPWFLKQMPRAFDSRWARNRLRVENAIGFHTVGLSYGDCQVLDPAVEGWDDLGGLTFLEIASRWKTHPLDVMLRLSQASGGSTLMLYHAYSGDDGNEAPLDSVLSSDLCLFQTDAGVRSKGHHYPAALGAFPKVLGHYVRERKLLSLEDAIRRMTSASADRFGLRDRGKLEPGKAADIVVFDPQSISETPPVGRQAARKPVGIRHVFLNGTHVVKEGSYVRGTRAGRVLRV